MTLSLPGQRETRAQEWTAVRARLGMPLVQPSRISRAKLKALPPPPARHEVVPWGVPVNLLAPASHKTIIKLVSLRHEVAMSDMTGLTRFRNIVAARNDAIALIYTHCPWLSLPQMGTIFGRDHTTILHSLEKVRRSPTRTVPAPYRNRSEAAQ